MGKTWLAVPRDWLASFGDIVRFCARVVGEVFTLKVFRFFGEALRQAGILILSSTLVIWGLIFIIGLQCGIEGAYFNRAVGSPAYAGVFAAWCDLRELVPYAFGYMMAAKVGTGIVAELGSMRISDEIDALEVMGISSLTFLCATRLRRRLARAAVHVPRGDRGRLLRLLPGGGAADRGGVVRRLLPDLLDVPEPARPLYSVIKGMAMATVIVLVGCYYGYTASGGPVGVGTATAKSMVLEHRPRAPDRHARHTDLLGRESPGTNRRLSVGLFGNKDKDDRDAATRQLPPPSRRPRGPARRADDPRAGERERRPPGASRSGPRRRSDARAAADERTRTAGAWRPRRDADDDEEYQWHTGRQRSSGSEDAVEFVEVHKAFGRNKILRGLNMGIPEDADLDDPRPVGHGQVGLHQAHGRAAVPRRRRRAGPRRVGPQHARRPAASRCARSSACSSRTARCSAR